MQDYLREYIFYVTNLFKKGKLKKTNEEFISLIYEIGEMDFIDEINFIKDKIFFLEKEFKGINYKIPFIKFEPDKVTKDTPVILCSMGRTNFYWFYEILSKISNKIKVIIYIYQHPGYYLSEPQVKCEETLYNAFEMFTDFLRTIHSNITLIGMCLSSFAVVKYLATHPEFTGDHKLIALVDNFPDIIVKDEKFKELMKEHMYSTRNFLPLIKNKITLFHCLKDVFISNELTQELFNLLTCQKELILLNSEGHSFLFDICDEKDLKLINSEDKDMKYLELIIRY